MTKSFTLVILGAFLLGLAGSVSAQDTLWTRTYGGSGYDEAYSVQQTTDGGYIAAGWTGSFGAGYKDFYLVKTDNDGDFLWHRAYGGSYDEEAFSVQQTTDGGYIVAGYTKSFAAGYNDDFYLVKTDADGGTLWAQTYGGSDFEWAYSVQQTTGGGYIVTGWTLSFGAGNTDLYLVKTDAFGDTLWDRAYGGTSADYGSSVQQTTDGGYIVAGSTRSFGAGSYDFYLVKTDAGGDPIWTRTYGGDDYDEAYSVQQTTDGGYIVAGTTRSFGAGGYDFYLVKTDADGDTLWTRTYGGSYGDEAYSVQQTTDGGYIVAGLSSSFGAVCWDVYLVKTDANGDTRWTRTYGGSGYSEAYSVQEATEGGYIVAGCTNAFGSGAYDFYLLRITEGGTSIEEKAMGLPASFSLAQNYPNPFNATTAFRFSLPQDADVRLEVYNLFGQKIATLVNSKQQAGYRSAIWDACEISSGVYFYKLTAGDFTETKRMILVK